MWLQALVLCLTLAVTIINIIIIIIVIILIIIIIVIISLLITIIIPILILILLITDITCTQIILHIDNQCHIQTKSHINHTQPLSDKDRLSHRHKQMLYTRT